MATGSPVFDLLLLLALGLIGLVLDDIRYELHDANHIAREEWKNDYKVGRLEKPVKLRT